MPPKPRGGGHPAADGTAPLTPRPRFGNRVLGGIDAARLHQAAADETDHRILDALVGIQNVLGAMQDNVKVQRRRVLWSGTAQIGASGIWHRRLPQGSMSIFVTNYSNNGLITVAAGAPLGAAPGLGAGVHNVPAGVAQAFNNDTNDWTLYGTPTNIVDVQIFSVPLPPTAAGNI